MMAYSGKYRVEGDKFVTAVDIAWHPAWAGDQTRFFKLVDDRLYITTTQLATPLYPSRVGRGVLVWRRS
jgi:hypothetical protein